MFVTTIRFPPGTVKSMTERSQSRLKFIREQVWYKLLPYELVNQTIKISLYTYFDDGVLFFVIFASNILQHTTHCNTQHTAARCNTLQHTSTPCNTRQLTATHTATHCNTLQHAATCCNMLQQTAKRCNTHTGVTASSSWTNTCNTLQHTFC